MSLTKLKTLEYRLFRKMREKLRNSLAKAEESGEALDKKDAKKLTNKFVNEAKQLCKENIDKLAQPFEFYQDICKLAYE